MRLVSWARCHAASGRRSWSGRTQARSATQSVQMLFSLQAPGIPSPNGWSLLSAWPGEGHDAEPGATRLQRALLVGGIHLAAVPAGCGFGAAPGQEPPLVTGEKLHFAVGRLIRHELLGVRRRREGFDVSIPAWKHCPSERGRDNLVSLVEPRYLIGRSAGAKRLEVKRSLGVASCGEKKHPMFTRTWGLLSGTLAEAAFSARFCYRCCGNNSQKKEH